MRLHLVVERIDANVVFQLLIFAQQVGEDPDAIVERAIKEYLQRRTGATITQEVTKGEDRNKNDVRSGTSTKT